MNTPKIIAEIGCNHKSDMVIAKEMIMSTCHSLITGKGLLSLIQDNINQVR